MVAGLFLVGCQGLGVPGEVSAPVDTAPHSDVTQDADGDSTDPGDTGADDQEVSATPCDAVTRAAIETAVIGQVNAFSLGDFDAAYAFASPGFQEGMSREVFGQLIRANYAQLLQATNPRSSSCDADEQNGFSTIVMRFDTPTTSGYTLRYVLEYVDNQWRIAGASEEAVPDAVA